MPIRSSKQHQTPKLATAIRAGAGDWVQYSAGLVGANTNGRTVQLARPTVQTDGFGATHPVPVTARFDLRPLSIEHAPLLADLDADPDVVKTLICD